MPGWTGEKRAWRTNKLLSEPRTISLLMELVHLPMVHAPERLRDVYNEVCRTCGYENFLRIQGGARIERRDAEGDGFSQLSFNGDRIQLVEDHTGTSVEQFGRRATAVLQAAMPRLGIPIILVQQNTVRVTANTNSFRSAGEYLARSVFKFSPGDFETLGRPVGLFGFRLSAPSTAEAPQSCSVRVECYVRDPRALYIENIGTFKMPIQLSGIELVETNLRMTAEFLIDKVLPFLSGLDRKDDE
jgi:hypothetical protein